MQFAQSSRKPVQAADQQAALLVSSALFLNLLSTLNANFYFAPVGSKRKIAFRGDGKLKKRALLMSKAAGGSAT